MPLFKPLQTDDETLNKVQRAISAAFDTIDRRPLADGQTHAPVVYAVVGGEIPSNASCVVYQGDGLHRLFLPMAAARTAVAGMLLIVNFGGGPIAVAASGTDTTYDGHELTVTPGRSIKVLSDGVSKWGIVGDEIWSSNSPDHWYEHECDYSVTPRIESGFASPVLYDKQMNFEWITSTFVWTEIDEGPQYPGVVEGLLGLSATAALRLATDLGAIYLHGRSRYVCWVKIPTLSTGVQRFIFRTGIADTYGTTITNCLGFRYSDDINSGRWQAITADAGVNTPLDTGVTVVADTWYRLEFDAWVPDGIARWYISTEQPDGEMGPSIQVAVYNNADTGDLPGSAMGVVPFDLTKTVGSTARSVMIHKHRFITNLGGPALPSGA